MSGHSKWASIKHKKGAIDAKRGQLFTKIIKEITVAARLGGGEMESNARLRAAIDRAKASNMPRDTMERAVKKGSGELGAVNYEEFAYEGYGPEGVAIIMDITTDNKNRTAAEVRKILSKRGGSLGSTGCVAWMFGKKGIINIESAAATEDALLEIVLEAGAEDLTNHGDFYEVLTPPDRFSEVLRALEAKGIKTENAEVSLIQTSGEPVRLEGHKAQQVQTLLDELEAHDDVSSIASNFESTED